MVPIGLELIEINDKKVDLVRLGMYFIFIILGIKMLFFRSESYYYQIVQSVINDISQITFIGHLPVFFAWLPW